MTSLFNKINTLLRARVEGFLEEGLGLSQGAEQRELLATNRLGKNIDHEIEALRKRIDEAINHEEHLQAQIDALQQQAADWDIKADNALLAGDEVTAHRALQEMKRLQQQAALLEADLFQHRRNAADFIERVNVLEGLVAEARKSEAPPAAQEKSPPVTLDAVLKTARQEVETLKNTIQDLATPQEDAQDDPALADDLATRRARLSLHSSENPATEE